MLASFDIFRVFKYNIMYEHMRRQSLKLHMFFKIKYLLFKKKVVVYQQPNMYKFVELLQSKHVPTVRELSLFCYLIMKKFNF